MEGLHPAPTMAGLHLPPVNTAVMTNTAASLPQTSSVIEVVPSRPILDQSSNLIAEVLPSEGFTLVNLDLESLQLDATAQQQYVEVVEEGEELDGGVNLVVKGSWWWCKDCNVKQKFGVGPSIEDHLRIRHSVSNKTEDPEFVNNSHIQQCGSRQAGKDGCSSDVISSVYTIPSDSVQDQNIETFIVIDGTTTVQVITKQNDDNTVLMTRLDNKPAVAARDSSKVLSNTGPSAYDGSGNSADVMKTLSEMRPIPVLPALQLTDTQPSSIVQAPSSPEAKIPEKESTASKVDIPEITSVDAVPESSISYVEDTRAESPVSKSVRDADSSGSENHTGKSSIQKQTVEDKKRIPKQTAEDKPSTVRRKPAMSNTESYRLVTRRKVYQKTKEDIKNTRLKKCSVHLTRLSSKEIHEVKRKPVRNSPKLKPTSKLAQSVKHLKDAKKSVSLKSQTSSNDSAKKNLCLVKSSKCVSHTERDVFNASPESDLKNDKKNNFSVLKSRTSSGRKVKKPARYKTGSEGEEDDEPQPDDQGQCRSPPATSATKTLQQKSPQNASRTRKRRFSSAVDDSEPETQVPDSARKAGSKKARDEHYSCEDCGRKFRFKNKLEKHRKLYAGQTMEKCTVCEVALHNMDLLNVHMYHMHLTKESTSCHTCGNILGSKRNLLNHLLTHPRMEGQTVANLIRDSCTVHECSVCDEPIIVGEGRVERHYLIHEKPVVRTCQKCGETFRHKKELYSHLKTHEDHAEVGQTSSDQESAEKEATGDNDNNQSTKPECVTVTEQPDTQSVSLLPDKKVIAESVKQIMKFEDGSQGSESPFTVTFVNGDTEGTESGGQRGSKIVKPLIFCELCKEKFTTKKLLYQHLKIHSSQVSGFADSQDVPLVPREPEPAAQPIDLSAGVPFGIPCSLVKVECQETESNFLRKSFTTTVEGLVIPGQMHYSCALCDREFDSESQARRHVNRFSQQRTILQCNMCSSRFHNLDLFNVHYAYIHQPAGAASCLTCKMDFNNKGDFITHLGNIPLSHPLSHKLGYSSFVKDACGTVTCFVCQKSMWNYPMNIANHTRKHRSLSCPICQQEMPYKYALFVHLQIHAIARSLSVDGKLSERERQQNEQIEKLHSIVSEIESRTFVESNERFSCSLCDGEVLRVRKNIHQHLDLHARKLLQAVREGQYFCPDCGESITVSDQAIAHHLSSHGHSQVVFVCIFCSQTFGSFDEFREHESRNHWLNAYFEKNMCEVCGKGFVSRQQFQKHIKLHEEKQGLFSCAHCKQTFRFESKLQKHMAKHNKGSYSCQFCGKLYMTKISLYRHEQVLHRGIKDFKHKCKLCEAQFINATHLRDHVTNKHTSGASYRCTQCGMGFQYLSTFARHKRVVHGGDTPYVCQECGEKFPQKKLLQRHMVGHTGVNPFQCPACPKSFGLERTMREHYDFCHQGIHRFVCPCCGSKFPRNRSLKRHMDTCRMSGVAQLEPVPPVYHAATAKVPIEIHGAVKQENAGLVVIQQV